MRFLLLAVASFASGAALVSVEACSSPWPGCDNGNSCFYVGDAGINFDAGVVDDAGQTDSATDPHDVTVDVTDASDAGSD